jgi:SAM-dependent methyltransferase
MTRSSQVERYQRHLLDERADYDHARQVYLKRRVFRTFDRLLRRFGGVGLDGRLLDTGGARGEFAEVCRESGLDATSVGIESGVDFERDRMPFDDGAFDVVTSVSVIEHLRDPSLYLDEVHRVLRPGGHVILVTPHWPYAARDFYDVYTHVQPYSASSLASALRSHGISPRAMVPWMVEKSDVYWTLPSGLAYRLAAWLPFTGLSRAPVPRFLKGRSTTLLGLGRREDGV